jgi:hypothetical protein
MDDITPEEIEAFIAEIGDMTLKDLRYHGFVAEEIKKLTMHRQARGNQKLGEIMSEAEMTGCIERARRRFAASLN